MCTPKKKRLDLNVPDWVVKEFKNRPQAETASLLMKCNFCKARSSHIWHMKFEDQQQLEFLYIFFYVRSTSHSCTGEVYLLLGDSCETSFISEGHCRRGMADRKRNEGRLWMECALSLLNGVCLNSNHITETSFHVHCANCIYVTDSLSLPLCPDVPRAKISGAKASCMKREKTHFRIFNPIVHTDLYNLLKFIFLWSDRHGTHTDIYIYICVFYI